MKGIDLSVIVACYNVGDYLDDCLKSIVQTKFPHDRLEVLAVDDGSTDHKTSDIIDTYAKKYSFVTALHKQNGGVSSARNYGLDHAHGKYVAFVDGDDVVPNTAYPVLMYTAETYGSNIVSGFVHRFDNLRNVRSFLHKFAIKDNKFDTTIAKTPSLLYDSTCWNKVYKLSFLNQNHIRFVKGILYEDLPFILKAHLLSNNDSVVKDTVYMWRWRPNSITNSRGSFNNLVGRIASLDRCRNDLINAGYDSKSQLYKDFVKKALTVDLPIYLENIGDTPEPYIYHTQEIVYKFLRSWGLINSSIIKSLSVKFQILYYAIASGNFNLMMKYSYTHNIGVFFNKRYSHKPQYRIPELSMSILKHINVNENSLRKTQHLTKLKVDLNDHLIYGSGMFKIKHMHLVKRPFTANNYAESLGANLENIDNGKFISITFHRKRTLFYKRVLHPTTSWTNSRYEFSFDYQKACDQLGQGRWIIKVGDLVGNYQVTGLLGHPTKERNEIINPIKYNSIRLSNDFLNDWTLVFRAKPLKLIGSDDANWVTDSNVQDKKLIFKAGLINPESITPEIITDSDNDSHVNGRIVQDHKFYKIVFDLKDFPVSKPYHLYDLKLVNTATNYTIPYMFDNSVDTDIDTMETHQLIVKYQSANNIQISYVNRPLVVDDFSLKNNQVAYIHLRSYYHINDYIRKHMTIEVLSMHKKTRYILKPSQILINGFNLILHIPLLSEDNKQLKMLKGRYHFIFYMPLNGRIQEVGLTMESDLEMPHFKDLPLKSKQDRANYRMCTNPQTDFLLKIHQHRKGKDRKRTYRALNYSVLYPLMRLLPIHKHTIIFDCYWGTQFSSNERAIYEYIQKHDPQYKCVWVCKNDQMPIPGNCIRVKPLSKAYWYYLATAKYIFQNTNMPDQYLKRPNQIEVETLHGTFLKHMGFDEPQFRNGSKSKQNRFARRIRRWDYMVVPSNYMAYTASNAFDYHQRLIKSGFPRNDELITNNHQDYIDSVKHKLGIPLDKKIILYAPTYRKGDHRFMIDLDHLQKTLPNNYVLLVRLHYFVAHSHSFYNYPNFVYDVSDYPDINDLYLISDAMITDYSSVMFDYAYLKKPMIFYPYDHNMYLDKHNRGVYLDYQHNMPGPIVYNQQDLEICLLHLDDIKVQYSNQIKRFSSIFAQYGTKGNATKQVVNTVLESKNSQLEQEPDRHVIFDKFLHWFTINNLQSALLNYLGQVLPKRNIIIFDSFFGTQFSDNPKALYEYIKKHYPKYKLYWNVNAEDIDFFKKHHIPYIKRFGFRGLIKQAQAKYWIVNARRPFRWQPPRDSKILMTWHGTPLKTIGADVAKVTMPSNNARKYHRQVYNDNKRWDYLLTPNLYTTHIMYRAFRKNANQLILGGYPRNDILVNHNDTKTINKIKDRLGIDHHKKVVLYAPTWRDDEFVKSDEFIAHIHLDLDKIRKHFHNNVIILIRVHYMISNHLDLSRYKDIAMNVSDYPDIADLYLISDVLITDYSSVMFDYSILKRPMIFFDYDFKNYADTTRGFYFDFRKVAPGKIVTTTDGVIQQLDHIFNGHWHMNQNYKNFINKFDQWMDGKSSARVAKQFLTESNVKEHQISRQSLHLPSTCQVKYGASMWKSNKDFTNYEFVGFYKNNTLDTTYHIDHAMQLESNSFNQLIGMRYVLLSNKKQHVWVNVNDLILSK